MLLHVASVSSSHFNVVISPIIRYSVCAAQVCTAVRQYLPSGIANAFTITVGLSVTAVSNFSIPISVFTTSILVVICSAVWSYALRASIWKEKYGSGIVTTEFATDLYRWLLHASV